MLEVISRCPAKGLAFESSQPFQEIEYLLSSTSLKMRCVSWDLFGITRVISSFNLNHILFCANYKLFYITLFQTKSVFEFRIFLFLTDLNLYLNFFVELCYMGGLYSVCSLLAPLDRYFVIVVISQLFLFFVFVG